MDRKQWLEERKSGIGGSDAAAIIGLSDWESPYSVWADKMGYLPAKEDSEAMRQGRDLEAYVAGRFTELTGKKVRRNNKMQRHPVHTFMLANIDRDIVGERSGLECKTTSVMNTRKFKGGEFPVHYYCQCVHYMTVLNYTRWYLAVLVLNAQFMVYQMTRIENDTTPEWCTASVYVGEEEISSLIEEEKKFWSLVEAKTQPEIDGMEATKRALLCVHPADAEKEPVSLYEMDTVVTKLDFWKQQKKEAEKEIALHNNQIIDALNGSTRGLLTGKEIVLQTIKKQPYTVNPKPYTMLRIKTLK